MQKVGCNHIVLVIAALCLCRLGAPKNVVMSMIHTLANLRHHICTTYGDSNCYQGQENWEESVVGIGQGNGAGPQIWVAVSSPLFDILQQKGFVATFICTLSREHRALAGFTFIDDTNLIVTSTMHQTNEVIQQMNNMLTIWNGLLNATGGALVPDKCFWYLIDFKWEYNAWQ